MITSLFQQYWAQFSRKTIKERERYFTSLSKEAQRNLVRSFFNEGWHELFICNIVDDHLDFIKRTYGIDLFDLRISAMKGRTFLCEKKVWDHIDEILSPYQDFYNMNILFGGLRISPWGKRQQFYLIKGA